MTNKTVFTILLATILILSITTSVHVFADSSKDKKDDKKPKTLDQLCSKLDDKDDFKALVCAAILNISNSIQNMQTQIAHIQLFHFPQRCPPGQEMVGIDIQGQIICEISTAQSQTAVIVTLNPSTIQVDPNNPHTTSVALAAIGLSPLTSVKITDDAGNMLIGGTSTNIGAFSNTIPFPTNAPPGQYFLHVTDQNGRTGSAVITAIVAPPPPPPPTPTAKVTLNPTSGPAGTLVSLTATGLTPNTSVTVSVANVPVTLGTSDNTGAFSLSIAVPAIPMGPYEVRVTDSNGVFGIATFTVT